MMTSRRVLFGLMIPIAIGIASVASGLRVQISADDPSPPDSPVKLIFIHHSTGENWLQDDWGGLGLALRDNNYFVSDTNYGWGPDGIGDLTDIGHWWNWFRGPSSGQYTSALYGESDQHSWYSRRANDPGGANEIVMFKSCFPNSNLQGDPDDPPTTRNNPLRGQDAYSEYFTVANAKGIYNDILEYFATRQDKLFVVITAPPLSAPDHPENARAFNLWLVNEWLAEYPHDNVAVFDFYNVLTSNGGSPDVNDLGAASGNHHRWRSGAVEHVYSNGQDTSAYPSDPYGDDHPSPAGSRKATGEFVDLLNVFYHRWQGGGTPPTPTPTPTLTPTPTPTVTPRPTDTPAKEPRRPSGRARSGPSATPTPTPTPGAGGTIVRLTIAERDGLARDNAPVTSGVPLPASANIRRSSTLGLIDAQGRSIPVQWTVLARWGGPPEDESKPIRWLLADFQVDIAANHSTFVDIATGCDIAIAPSLEIAHQGSRVSIDTGEAQFVIDGGDGSLSGSGLRSPVVAQIVDSSGEVYTNTLVRELSVESEGPMRAAVLVRGSYRSASGAVLLDGTTRYWFHAGSAAVRVFHTVENNTLCTINSADGQPICNDIGSPGTIEIADASLVIPAELGGNLAWEASGTGGRLDDALLVYQDSSGTASWDHFITLEDWDGSPVDARPRMQAHVGFRGYRTTLGGAVVDSGDHHQGWMTVSGSAGAWTVGVRDFWQNFPKALRAGTDGSIEIGLFPDEFGPAGYAFQLRCGEHKTHELFLAPAAVDFGRPLMAVASSGWYAECQILDGLAVRADAAWPEYEGYVDDQLDTASAYQSWMDWFPNLPTAIAATDFYGIFDFGDVPLDYEGLLVAPMNLKYDMDLGMWKQWLRSQDPRWFDLAQAADRHIADIDILHNLNSPRYWSDGIMFGHSYHDEWGLVNPHRNYGGNHPDTMYGARGLLAAYYLTGDEKALEAALEIADCIVYRLHNDSWLCPYFSDCSGEGYGLGDQAGLYDSATRPVANSLSILVEAYRATGEQRYLDVAEALVDWSLASKQPYIDGPTGDSTLLKPWLINLYLRALASYIDMRAEFGLGGARVAKESFTDYVDFLTNWVWLDIDPVAGQDRGAYPYEWFFDQSGASSEPSVNNWLLLGADALAVAHRITGSPLYLDLAERLFVAGSHDPWYEGDENTYSSTKETANSIVFGQTFLIEFAGHPKTVR